MMSKFLMVARYEFVNTLKRRSVLFILFGLPLLLILITMGFNAISNAQSDGDDADGGNIFSALVANPDAEFKPSGLVDEAGFLLTLPEEAEQLFKVLPDAEAAAAAFNNDEILDYFVIPGNYLKTGQVEHHTAETGLADANEFREYALFNLLADSLINEEEIATRLTNPTTQVDEVDITQSGTDAPINEENFGGAVALSVGVALIFFMTVFGMATYMVNSLGKEKETRVMEILLSSLRPIDLLIGKILGLGAIGLLQVIIWLAIGLAFAGGENSSLISVLNTASLPKLSLATWLIIGGNFLAGYLVYAALFAGLGAIAPNLKEASQVQFFVMLPILIPAWSMSIFLSAPNSPFAVALSLIPLTSPLAMPIRLALTAVPLWQSLLALTLALVTGVGTILLTTRIFRGRTLLSGQSLSFRTAWQAIRGH